MIGTLIDIPSARDVDFTNAEAVCGYQLLLCKIFERVGGFDLPLKTNATIREVQRQGALWLKEVRPLIADILTAPVGKQVSRESAQVGMASAPFEAQSASRIALAAIPDLLDSYNLLYRVCNGGPCYDYLREVKSKTADRWLKGDKSISETDVALLLLSETDRNICTLEKRFYSYAISMMGKWIEELSRHGRFINARFPEAYKRLAYLLRQDLFVYFSTKDQQRIKSQWVKAYALADDQLDRLATKDLWSYISFANTASYLGSPEFEDHIARYTHLLSKLASRPDLHPYYRQGIELDLAQYQLA